MMMKKLLTMLLATTISLSSAVTAFAATSDDNLATNQKYVASEKDDKNTVYFYSEQSEQYSKAYVSYLKKQAKSITEGISGDYEKFKVINKWVSDNVWYDHDLGRSTSGNNADGKSNYFDADHSKYADVEVIAGDKTQCDGYADLTVGLLRAAGIPAKEMYGYLNSRNHAWVEAYVGGEWVFADPTLNSRNNYNNGKWYDQTPSDGHYFDLPLDVWSLDHRINPDLMEITGEKYVFNGKILFYSSDHRFIKEVDTDLTAGGTLDSTYGFDADSLYKDFECTEPWDLDTDVVKEAGTFIVVKDYKPNQYTIYFDSRGGSAVNPVSVGAEGKYTSVSIAEPPKPTRDGYDFVGWYPARYEYYAGAKVVDFKTWKVSDNDKFYAIWKDKSTGTIAPTTATTTTPTTATNTVTTPTTPTKAAAKVTGWSNADGHWRYYDNKGTMQLGWLNDNGTWYHLGGSGVMKTGCWLQDRGKWYYLTASGAMAHDTVIDGYTIGSDGAWIK